MLGGASAIIPILQASKLSLEHLTTGARSGVCKPRSTGQIGPPPVVILPLELRTIIMSFHGWGWIKRRVFVASKPCAANSSVRSEVSLEHSHAFRLHAGGALTHCAVDGRAEGFRCRLCDPQSLKYRCLAFCGDRRPPLNKPVSIRAGGVLPRFRKRTHPTASQGCRLRASLGFPGWVRSCATAESPELPKPLVTADVTPRDWRLIHTS